MEGGLRDSGFVQFRTGKLEKCYLKLKQSVREFDPAIWRKYIQKINIIKAAKSLDDLKTLPGLGCHPLKGDRIGQHAINLTGLAISPDEYLEEVLEDMGLNQAELARRMGRPAQAVNEIIKGEKAITPETSIQLEKVLSVPAYIWSGLESEVN